MTETRKIAAILAADVVGFSRLANADEDRTLARLRALRTDLIDPIVASQNGRVFKRTGDGALVEFRSVVEAVRCAITIQNAMTERNVGMPPDQRIEFRIGIHLGDVVEESDGDLMGDGVNVAARLEGIAKPSAICLSEDAYRQVKGRLDLSVTDLGLTHLKNIAEPIRAYSLQVGLRPAAKLDQIARPPEPKRRSTLYLLVSGAVALIAIASGAWFYLVGSRPVSFVGASPTRAPSPEAAKTNAPEMAPGYEKLHTQAPGAPNIPPLSIVVLPFLNLNNDPDQDYFAESVTSDLTTDLSRIEDSFVIASATAMSYKGKGLDPRAVAQSLGVRYALSGSVHLTGDQIRVNAELVDAVSGAQIWSDRFDRDRATSADLQDELVARLARSLDLELTDAESRRAELNQSGNPDASAIAMRGWSVLNRSISKAQLQEAQRLFERSLSLDARPVRARIGLARTLAAKVNARLSDSQEADLARAEELESDVLSKHQTDAMAQFVKADILRARKQFESAIATYKTTIALDRNFAPAYGAMASALLRAGHSAEAIQQVDRAVRLSPLDPQLSFWLYIKGHAYAHLGRDAEAIEWCLKSLASPSAPYWLNYVDLASAYAWLGRDDEAKSAVQSLLTLKPGYTVERWQREGWSDNAVFLQEYAHIVEGLRKAGLPPE